MTNQSTVSMLCKSFCMTTTCGSCATRRAADDKRRTFCFANMQSMTYTVPSMVTDVSAMLVAAITCGVLDQGS